MIAFLVTVSLAADDGGYKPIAVTDPLVAPAQAYLNRVFPNLFPDAKGGPTIESAEVQVVHGSNLRLNVSAQRLIALTTVLYLKSDADPPKIVSIVGRQVATVPSGWQWQDVASVSAERLKEIKTVLSGNGGFTGEVLEFIAIRSQIVAGQNWHVIFRDTAEVLWAAVVYFPLANGAGKVSYLHKAQ
jgi:hypothetical protein